VSIFGNIDVNVRKKQGNLGVARAVYEYTKLGYVVLAPMSDSEKYDLVIDTGSELLKVQVKTSRCKSGSGCTYNRTGWAVNLSTKGGNTKTNNIRRRQAGDYDMLFVLVDSGDCWSIPVAALGTAGATISVGATGDRAKYTEYKL
jgi:hypothetical protein